MRFVPPGKTAIRSHWPLCLTELILCALTVTAESTPPGATETVLFSSVRPTPSPCDMLAVPRNSTDPESRTPNPSPEAPVGTTSGWTGGHSTERTSPEPGADSNTTTLDSILATLAKNVSSSGASYTPLRDESFSPDKDSEFVDSFDDGAAYGYHVNHENDWKKQSLVCGVVRRNVSLPITRIEISRVLDSGYDYKPMVREWTGANATDVENHHTDEFEVWHWSAVMTGVWRRGYKEGLVWSELQLHSLVGGPYRCVLYSRLNNTVEWNAIVEVNVPVGALMWQECYHDGLQVNWRTREYLWTQWNVTWTFQPDGGNESVFVSNDYWQEGGWLPSPDFFNATWDGYRKKRLLPRPLPWSQSIWVTDNGVYRVYAACRSDWRNITSRIRTTEFRVRFAEWWIRHCKIRSAYDRSARNSEVEQIRVEAASNCQRKLDDCVHRSSVNGTENSKTSTRGQSDRFGRCAASGCGSGTATLYVIGVATVYTVLMFVITTCYRASRFFGRIDVHGWFFTIVTCGRHVTVSDD